MFWNSEARKALSRQETESGFRKNYNRKAEDFSEIEFLCPFPCGFEYRDKDGVDLCKGLQYEFFYAPVI